ncbi:flagellar hook-associated protein FlgL [Hathewaya massiliensis]|uniref:flagellar hook-associated protein FlgL n=1 Tax=Hathewaya massiliensis TaxID=1964382 RepID=UPI0011575B1D|nr:flagellar hook-associated protein FlgL [Hathewaya massiliensis]
MRITNKMLSNNFLRDMNVNLRNLSKLQEQRTSGKEFKRPSDDPFRVARSMQLHTEQAINEQYKKNITDTINWLDVTDTSLKQASGVLDRIHQLVISAGNAAYGETERGAVKDEINQKVSELSQILNANFDGKYVFGGTRVTSKPLETTEVDGNKVLNYSKRGGGTLDPTADKEEYAMIREKLKTEISQGVILDYNVTATEIMKFKKKDGTDGDLMVVLKNITDHLDSKPDEKTAKEALLGTDLQDIKDAMENILKIRSEVGAKQNRTDSAKEKNVDQTLSLKAILSETEDIDITEKTMEFAIAQTVYVASLQTSAKVLQPSLMDYLR